MSCADEVRMRFKYIGMAAGLAAVALAMRGFAIERDWQEMMATKAEFQELLDSVDAARPVLHGEPLDGSAFDEYELAEALLSPTAHDDWMACRSAKLNGLDSRIELRNALIDDNQEALAALERGARRTDARFDPTWSSELGQDLPSLLRIRALINISLLAAERDIEEGNPELGVDRLLDGMQLGRDFMHSSNLLVEMMGSAFVAMTSHEALVRDGLLDCLPAPSLARLAEGMQTLDGSLSPRSTAWEGEIVSFIQAGQNLAAAGELGNRICLGDPDLLDCFDSRSTIASYVCQARSIRDCMREFDDATFFERQEVLETLAKEDGTWKLIGSQKAAVWKSAETSRADVIALLRLSLMAIEYRATSNATTLEDPFGDELLLTEHGDTVLIESAGHGDERSRNRFRIEIARNES